MLLNFLILSCLSFYILFQESFKPDVMKIFPCVIFSKVYSFVFHGYTFNPLEIGFCGWWEESSFIFHLWGTNCPCTFLWKVEKSTLSLLWALSQVKCVSMCGYDSGLLIVFHQSLSISSVPIQHCLNYCDFITHLDI